jgi:SAM-dependent methyltransferase
MTINHEDIERLFDHDGNYKDWRRTRITKVENLFGKDFFRGKKILELGCAMGHTGRHFEELGAIVTFAEGRQDIVNTIEKLNPESKIIQLDQEDEWDLGEKFDIIIHWGVLYHLDHWKEDLACAVKHSDLIFLESEVVDSDDPDMVVKANEHKGIDQALNESSVGSRPSPAAIEKHLTELGMTFTRYDDADLDASFHQYSWEARNTGHTKDGQRRFWIVRKSEDIL